MGCVCTRRLQSALEFYHQYWASLVLLRCIRLQRKQPGCIAICGRDRSAEQFERVGGALYSPQRSNFGPQLGLAWQPRASAGRLVIRGGFGINYNQNEIAILSTGFGNPPNVVNANFCCSTTTSNAPGILYEPATSINSFFGYVPNPAAVTAFGANIRIHSGNHILPFEFAVC